MSRFSIVLISAAVLVLAGAVAWQQLRQQAPSAPVAENTAVNLGFSYLNITPKLSACYRLGADSGVLVTEVTPDSLADRAGIKPGDVIRSFNSIKLEEGTPLFGMMQTCPVGNQIVVEVIRGENSQFIELMHITAK